MKPREVVASYLNDVLGGARPASAEDILADGELERRTNHLRSAFPDLEIETRVLLADHDLVACHLVGRGTHRGIFQGAPPTGRTIDARATAVYRVCDGRIVEAWVTWDTLSLMEQLGAVNRAATVSA